MRYWIHLKNGSWKSAKGGRMDERFEGRNKLKTWREHLNSKQKKHNRINDNMNKIRGLSCFTASSMLDSFNAINHSAGSIIYLCLIESMNLPFNSTNYSHEYVVTGLYINYILTVIFNQSHYPNTIVHCFKFQNYHRSVISAVTGRQVSSYVISRLDYCNSMLTHLPIQRWHHSSESSTSLFGWLWTWWDHVTRSMNELHRLTNLQRHLQPNIEVVTGACKCHVM